MKGSTGRNRTACNVARVAPGLTISISAVAAEMAPDGYRYHAQRRDIGLCGTASAVRGIRRLEGEPRTGVTRGRGLAVQLRRQEEEDE